MTAVCLLAECRGPHTPLENAGGCLATDIRSRMQDLARQLIATSWKN
jgi:hypothetical protein